jgi:hypothetical protein
VRPKQEGEYRADCFKVLPSQSNKKGKPRQVS